MLIAVGGKLCPRHAAPSTDGRERVRRDRDTVYCKNGAAYSTSVAQGFPRLHTAGTRQAHDDGVRPL